MRLAIASLILLLSSCASSRSLPHAGFNHEFKLRLQEAALVGSEPVTVRFHSLIQDSRCPKEVQCIAAGKASIELELLNAQKESTKIELSTDSGSNETTYEKYNIKLVEVSPYPIALKKTDPARYTITLVVSTK